MFREFQIITRKNLNHRGGGSGGSLVSGATGTNLAVVSTPPIELELEKIMTTDPAGTEFTDDDFAPLLGEKAHIYVKITNLPTGVVRKLQVNIGRKIKTGFALAAEVTKEVTGTGNPITEKMVWDGKATKALVRQLSDRKTKDLHTAADVNIPLEAIVSGKEVTHGLYVINKISLLNGVTEVKAVSPADVGMSVPTIISLTFNGSWIDDLKAFGLEQFSDKLKQAIRCFGDRDYMINDATVTNRINARYVLNAGTSNRKSMVVSIGGADGTNFGGATFLHIGRNATWKANNPWYDNIFAAISGLGSDIKVNPGTFMLYNTDLFDSDDRDEFRKAFKPIGVESTASHTALGTATARAVDVTGKVTGACSALDLANSTVAIDANGKVTVTSTATDKVPAARARAIQLAMNYFVRMVGNTTNHEIGHSFGVVSERNSNNEFKVDGSNTAKSPLNGDSGAHNRVGNSTNIMDGGPTRSYRRRVETTDQQKFLAANAKYMRGCVPYDPVDD